MQNKGLLFIPDISGFSKFVSETEIEHSRLIIQELLEILINSNMLGLEISEIEGDAILFYKFGDPPTLPELYKQVEKMFCEFHRNLIAYEQRRYCQCTACQSAAALSLKVISHYGEFTEYNVKNFHKLIGKDLIVAHQLLKNNIEQHEYWLVTQDLLGDNTPQGIAQWMTWNSSVKQTDTGEVVFQYTQLGQLKNTLLPEPIPLELDKKVKIISLSKEYDTDIITLFHATGDFTYRNRWLEGVKDIEVYNHFLPRVGMKCRYLLDDGEETVYASSYSYSPDRVEFNETDDKKEKSTQYRLERISENKTKLTLDIYLKKSLPGQILFNLIQKGKLEKTLIRSMENLVFLVKQIKIPKSTIE